MAKAKVKANTSEPKTLYLKDIYKKGNIMKWTECKRLIKENPEAYPEEVPEEMNKVVDEEYSIVMIETDESDNGFGSIFVHNSQIIPSKSNKKRINIALNPDSNYYMRVWTDNFTHYKWISISSKMISENYEDIKSRTNEILMICSAGLVRTSL